MERERVGKSMLLTRFGNDDDDYDIIDTSLFKDHGAFPF